MGGHNKFNIIIILLLFSITTGAAVAETFKTGVYPGNSFIDPTVVINAVDFSIGKESYVAPFSVLKGDSVHIGDFSDLQDGVKASGRITIENNAVVAHGANLEGNVTIGEHAFVGFNSMIKDSKIGNGAYINVGSTVKGVDIPPKVSVPAGMIIDNVEDIDGLLKVTDAQKSFVNEVIAVNRALATGYVQLFQKDGPEVFRGVGPAGDGDILVNGADILWRKGINEPVIGKGVALSEQQTPRIIGSVYIGDNSKIDSRTSVRGDEGAPISIGNNATIGKGNIFHSLDKTDVEIGNDFVLGDNSVIHGPLVIGDNIKIGDKVIVFKSDIGNNVVLGDNSIVTGVTLFSDVIIPPDTVITNQKDARIFNRKVLSAFQSEQHPSMPGMALVAIPVIAIGFISSYLFRNRK